jgi:hypothetical protein
MRQRIPGRADRHTTVEVFEPSQHEDMAPRVLDRFVLAQGEDRLDYEMPSATAAFRYVDPLPEELEGLEQRRRENPSAPTPAQEAEFYTPEVNQEMATGEARQRETEQAEAQLQKRRDEAARRAEKASGQLAKERGFKTGPHSAPQGSNVGNVHVARDPQGHPVRVAEPVPGARPRADAGADPHTPTRKSGGVSTAGSAPEEAQEGRRVMSEPEVADMSAGSRRGPKPGSKGAQKKAENAAKRDAKKAAKRQGAEKATKRSYTKRAKK